MTSFSLCLCVVAVVASRTAALDADVSATSLTLQPSNEKITEGAAKSFNFQLGVSTTVDIPSGGSGSNFAVNFMISNTSNGDKEIAGVTITPTITSDLTQGLNASSPVTLQGNVSLTVSKAACQSSKFLCASVKPVSSAYADSDTTNDKKCIKVETLCIPGTPTTPSSSSTSDSVTVSWNAPSSGAAQYEVNLTSPSRVNTTTHTTYTFDKLAAGSTYTIQVVAISQEGSLKSDPLEFTVKTDLAPVSEVTASNPTTTTVDVTWKLAPGSTDNYILSCASSTTGTKTYEGSLPNTATNGQCTDLTPGAKYEITVTTRKAGHGDVIASAIYVNTPLSPATSVQVTGQSTTSLTASWSHANGSKAGYVLSCEGDSGTKTSLQVSDTSASCNGLTPGSSYNIKVITKQTGWDDVSTAGTLAKTDLAPVTEVTASNPTTTTVDVTWKLAPGSKDNYILSCASSTTGTKTYEGSLPNTASSGQCTDLTPGTKYNVTVTTKKSGHRNVIATALHVYTYPSAPGELQLANNGKQTNSLHVQWQSAIGNVVLYDVSVENLGSGKIGDVRSNSSAASVKITGLTPGKSYKVIVKTHGDGGKESAPKSKSFTTEEAPPGSPGKPSFGSVLNDSVTLDWTSPREPNGVILRYWVIYKDVSLQSSKEINTLSSATTHTVTGLIPGTSYSFSVQAENSKGRGGVSDEVTTRTTEQVAGVVSSFTVTHHTSRSMSVQWGPPTQPNGIIVHYLLLVKGETSCLQALLFNCTDCTGGLVTGVTMNSVRAMTQSCQSVETGGEYQSARMVNHVVRSLKPYTNYTFVVFAVNGEGTGQQVEITKQTLEDVPTTAVDSSSIKANRQTTSITLTWDPPSEPNGAITHYSVKFKYPSYTDAQPLTSGEVNTTSSATTWTFTELQEFWNYSYTISTYTKHGNGGLYSNPPKTFQTIETAPGPMTDVFSDSTKLHHNAVFLKFKPPTRLELNGVLQKYFIRYFISNQETSAKEITLDDVTLVSYNVTGLEPYTNYTFELWAETCPSCEGSKVTINERTKEYYPTAPWDVTNTEKTSNSITLQWKKPNPPNGVITHYTLFYRLNGNASDTSKRTEGPQLSLTIRNLKADQIYILKVAAWTRVGMGPYSNEISIATEIAVPGEPTDVKVTDLTPTTFKVSWTPPIPNPGPTSYTVLVYDMGRLGSDQDKIIGNPLKNHSVTGYTQSEYTVTDLDEYWRYKVTVMASTEKGPSSVVASNIIRTSAAAPEPAQHLQLELIDNDYVHLIVKWNLTAERGLNGQSLTHFIKGLGIKDSDVHSFIHQYHQDVSDSFSQINKTFSRVIGVKSEFTYDIQVFIGVNSGGQILNSTSIKKTKQIPAGPPPTPSSRPTAYSPDKLKELRPDINVKRQAGVKFNCSFFTSNEHGDIVGSGLVVVEASMISKVPSLTRDSYNSVKSKLGTWQAAKDKDFKQPYLALIELDSHACSSTRKRREAQARSTELVIIGKDEECIKRTDICNGYLHDGLAYQVKAFACTAGGCSETEYVRVETEDDITTVIVGAVVGVLVFLIIVVVLIIMKRKQIGPFKEKKPTKQIVSAERGEDNIGFTTIDEMPLRQRSKPIPLDELAECVRDMHRDSNMGFSEEYETVKELSAKSSTSVANLMSNRNKNRYINILPFDHTRVKLLPIDDSEGSDYINANYMPGYNSRREFIAAQGPLEQTVNDFWRMIWEQNVSVVVMVTRCIEGVRQVVKCAQYWPNDTEPTVNYGDLVVIKRAETNYGHYTLRVLDVRLGSLSRTIKQLHFTVWPDHDVPSTTESLLNFVKVVRSNINSSSRGPVVVHCSAGVGRTGTFICLDRLLQQVDNQSEVDILGMVLEMRERRCNMVQTETQYVFIHDCIRDYLETRANAGNKDGEDIYENTTFSRK